MKTRIAWFSALFLAVIFCLFLSAAFAANDKPDDPAPAEPVAPAVVEKTNDELYSDTFAAFAVKRSQGKHAEALALAHGLLKGKDKDGKAVELKPYQKWTLKTYEIPLLMAQPYSGDAAGLARAQSAIDYCIQAQQEKWEGIEHPREQVTALYQLYAWYKVDIDRAMAELDRSLSVATSDTAPDIWGVKLGILMHYRLQSNFPQEKRDEWNKAAVIAATKVLLLNPGAYGKGTNNAPEAALGVWTHLKRLAPDNLSKPEFMDLCRKLLRAYVALDRTLYADMLSDISVTIEAWEK